jgi:hypothetical protein
LPADLEILHHRQLGEDAAVFRHVAQAKARDLVRRQMVDARTFEGDLALARWHQPHDRLERRRLAGAVAAEQRHDLAGAGFQRNAVENMSAAVVGVEIRHREHQCALPR